MTEINHNRQISYTVIDVGHSGTSGTDREFWVRYLVPSRSFGFPVFLPNPE